jgi:hypothetical protein
LHQVSSGLIVSINLQDCESFLEVKYHAAMRGEETGDRGSLPDKNRRHFAEISAVLPKYR